MAALHRRARAEGGLDVELELLTSAGAHVPVAVAIAPVVGASTDAVDVVETLTDVSGRHAVESERRAAVERGVALEQEALRRVAGTVSAEQDPRRVFAQVAEQARRVLSATSAVVVRFEPEGRATVVGAAGGSSRSGPRLGSRMPLEGAGVVARVHRVAAGGPPPGGDDDGAAVAAGSVGVPVHVAGGCWGAVCAFGPDTSAPEARRRLVRFAELVGLAIASADARRDAGRAASLDALTGLPSARSFRERLASEVERARRHGRELGLVLLDVDNFARINEIHGQEVGDGVLRELSRRLGEVARTGEMIARVGGEEFGWIVPEAGGLGAYAAAERARAAVARAPFGAAGRITLSAGVCDLAQSPGGGGELYRLADVALYWAKANGRDATFRYSPEVIQVLSAEQQAGTLARAQAVSAIRVLARAVDAKHPDTRRHSERVAGLAHRLAGELGWSDEARHRLREAAMVHDVGKISIPDAILLKEGRLDESEYARVTRHAAAGAEIVAGILDAEQVDWVRHHHERLDGEGYPDRLRDAQISDGAAILAVADAWDAMTRSRSYRDALGDDEAMAECRRVSGRQFRPEVVDALEDLWRRGEISDAALAQSPDATPGGTAGR